MLKKIIICVLSAFSLASQAAELRTFSDVERAIGKGKEMVFVISLNACQADFPLANIQISVKPNALMLIAGKRVTASDKHFTLNEPGFIGTPVVVHGKYDIKADGSTGLHVSIMNARDYQLLSSKEITCELGKGFKVFAKNTKEKSGVIGHLKHFKNPRTAPH